MLFPQFPTHFARNNLRRGSAEFSLKKLRGLKIPGVTNVCVGVTKTRSYSWACVMECGTENWESQRREWRHWPAGSRASNWKPPIQGNNHLIEHSAQQLALSKEERSAVSWQHPLEPTVVPPAHSLPKLEGVMWRGCHQPKTYTVGPRPWV